MSELPLSIGTMHFTGIGGIGMSGIAEILFELGYDVQGSDMSENANVRRLRAKGINVITGQSADNVENAALVVISTAIKADNPEVIAARAAVYTNCPPRRNAWRIDAFALVNRGGGDTWQDHNDKPDRHLAEQRRH